MLLMFCWFSCLWVCMLMVFGIEFIVCLVWVVVMVVGVSGMVFFVRVREGLSNSRVR